MSVQAWLTKCIYHRYRTTEQYEKNKGDQVKGQILVYFTSAFWHGFYPGYYFSFFFWWFYATILTTLWRIGQKKPAAKAAFEKLGYFGTFIAWALASVGLTYFGSYFQLLSLGDCIQFMRNLYFIPNISIVVICLLLLQIPLGDGSHRGKKDHAPKKPLSEAQANPEAVRLAEKS